MKIFSRYFFWITIVLFTFLGYSACTNTEKEAKSDRNKNISDLGDSEEDLFDDADIFFLLLSPGEIIERLTEANIVYIKELTNPVSNSNNYIDLQSQSMNLGIYIADMAYSAVFTRSNETIEYLDVIQSLSNEVNISSSAFSSLAERSKANVGNMDSLLLISNDVFYNMIEFLETGGKENIISLISAGAYIETIYIALNSVEEYEEDNDILNQIIDLKFTMDNCRDRAALIRNDPNIIKTLKFLHEIDAIFNECRVTSENIEVSETNDGDINIGGGETFHLNEENFHLLKNKITEMRNTIVKI